MKAIALLLGSALLGASVARENFAYSTQCQQDEYFKKNYLKYRAIRDPPKSFQQQMLVNYYADGLDAADERFLQSMRQVNERYDFMPNKPYRESTSVQLEADPNVVIPYLTHWVWMTKRSEKKMFPKDTNVWKTIAKLNEDEGTEWRHVFWVTHVDAIELDEQACKGRCVVELLDDEVLGGFSGFQGAVEQLMAKDLFVMDALRALILYVYGGVFLDNDYVLLNSPAKLHNIVDFYSAFQDEDSLMNLKHGSILAARPKHQIMHTLLQLLFELNGQIIDVYGLYEVIPVPMQCVDFILQHGPRSFMMAMQMANNQNGNNDAIFKSTILLKDSGEADPDHELNWEYINVAGKKVRVDRIGYQTPGNDDWMKKCRDKDRDLMYIVDPQDSENLLSLQQYDFSRQVQRELKMNANEIAIQALYGCFIKEEFYRAGNNTAGQ